MVAPCPAPDRGLAVSLAHTVATLGLLLDIGGVALLFKFGPPQPDLSTGVSLGLEDGTPLDDGRTVAEHAVDQRAKKQRYASCSKAALGLIVAGFVLQAFSLWL